MPSTTEATSRAADLFAAAERLNMSVAAVDDPRDLDLREAVHLVSRALGELAAMSEALRRDYALAGSHQETPGPLISSDLRRRSHELASSLSAARRNAELVRRHLPPRRTASSPVAATAADGGTMN